jgi:hypothetical protein
MAALRPERVAWVDRPLARGRGRLFGRCVPVAILRTDVQFLLSARPCQWHFDRHSSAVYIFARKTIANSLYSMELDRPGLLCRDILSCAVFYNYML